MHLLVFILKKVELLEDIIKQLADHNITGGTILDAQGVAESLSYMRDIPMFRRIRQALEDEEQTSCKLLLFVLKDEHLLEARDTIREVVDLSAPNSGILFAMPLTFVEGLGNRSWN